MLVVLESVGTFIPAKLQKITVISEMCRVHTHTQVFQVNAGLKNNFASCSDPTVQRLPHYLGSRSRPC